MHQDKSARSADFEWAIKLNRFMLNILGIWPHIHANSCYKFLSDLRAMFSLFLLIFVGSIPMMQALVKTWGDMMATIDNLQYSLTIMTATVKLAIIWWRKADLVWILGMIADDWSKDKTDKELSVMIGRARNARAVTIFGYVVIILGILTGTFLPFFGFTVRYVTNVTDTGRLLPVQSLYFYDNDRTPYYELTFVAQSAMLALAGVAYSGVDNFLGMLILHLCGQMENFKDQMANMTRFKTFNYGLAYFVRDHLRLIKYFDIIEGTSTVLLLGLIVCFAILFCASGFLIIRALTQGRDMAIMRLMFLSFVAIFVFGHMLLYCIVGEILISQCEEIYRAVFDYEWYTLKPEDARSLILLMIRTSKPLYITAGKMFPMNMSMFCNLIKTSAGYISVLLARQS